MLPRWQTVATRCAYSTSWNGFFRVRTQWRKSAKIPPGSLYWRSGLGRPDLRLRVSVEAVPSVPM